MIYERTFGHMSVRHSSGDHYVSLYLALIRLATWGRNTDGLPQEIADCIGDFLTPLAENEGRAPDCTRVKFDLDHNGKGIARSRDGDGPVYIRETDSDSDFQDIWLAIHARLCAWAEKERAKAATPAPAWTVSKWGEVEPDCVEVKCFDSKSGNTSSYLPRHESVVSQHWPEHIRNQATAEILANRIPQSSAEFYEWRDDDGDLWQFRDVDGKTMSRVTDVDRWTDWSGYHVRGARGAVSEWRAKYHSTKQKSWPTLGVKW